MTVFLGFGDRVLGDTGVSEVFAHGVGDRGRSNEVTGRNVEVAVVFKHTCVNNGRNANAVEFVEISACLEGLGDLDRTVAAEVEEDYAVAVFNGAYGSAVFSDNECGEVLVDHAGFRAVGFDCFFCGSELSAFAENVGVPAVFNHLPVCFVTVHGDLHSAAAACDLCAEGSIVERSEECFEGFNVFESGGFANVTTVEKDVNAYVVYAFSLCLFNHCLEVVDVRVNVTVGEESEEVESRAVCYAVAGETLPGFAFKHSAGFDGFGDELCALRENLTGAECVVTNLGVTHVVVGHKTYGSAVSAELGPSVFLHESVEGGGICVFNSVARAVGSDADTVHNDGNDRTGYTDVQRGFVQFCHDFYFLSLFMYLK